MPDENFSLSKSLQPSTTLVNQSIDSMSGHAKAFGNVTGNVNITEIHQPLPRQLSLHQLPNDIADFTGREAELRRLIELCQPNDNRTAVVISAVAGMGGVGKSALAIHVAHQLTSQFSDAQLYVNLRGADDQPLEPFDVLGQWLRDFGLDASTVPADLPGRASAYRSLLIQKRAIILLDNASTEAQVRDLLPGSPSCAVLITSRRRLTALAGVEVLDLSILTELEALELLQTLISLERVQAEPESAAQIVNLCGRLPLALRIAGGTLKGKRHWSLETYAAKLAEEKQRLTQLQLSDLDVRSSFQLSYQELNDVEARTFQLIGLLLTDFTLPVAEFLTGQSYDSTLTVLENLSDLQLLQFISKDSCQLHDLIRLFAEEKFVETNGLLKQAAILNNLGDFYEREIQWKNAVRYYEKSRKISQELKDHRGEATSLLGLGYVYSDVRGAKKQLEKAFDYINEGLKLFQAIDDKNGIARAQLYLGNIYRIQRDRQKALECYEKSLKGFRFSKNKAGESSALNGLGEIFLAQGDIQKASDFYEQSVGIRFERGELIEAATGLRNIAALYQKNEEWEVALSYWKRSLQVYREAKDPLGEGDVLESLGDFCQQQNKLDEAVFYYQESLKVCRLIHKHDWEDWEPGLLKNLGDIYKNQGDLQESLQFYEEGLKICRDLCGYSLCKSSNEDTSGMNSLPTRFDNVRSIALEIIEELGFIYTNQKRWQDAVEIYQQSLQVKRELGNRYGEGQTLANLGALYSQQNQREKAIAFWQEALTKLHPDSPEAQQVAQRLAASTSLSRQHILFDYLIWLAVIAFIAFNLWRSHWLIALAATLLSVGFIAFRRWRSHSKRQL